MHRRTFLGTLTAASALGLLRPRVASAALPAAKITRVRIYRPPNFNPLFNQSNMVVTVETDIGITGVGEGGSKDTLEQCAGTLIGKNPFRIDAIWQEIYIAWFYPPGREKTHALGALDLALWDIKGKALGVPVHELLGGMARDYCECYATSGGRPAGRRRTSRSASRSAPARRWRPGIAPSAWARETCRLATSTTRAPSSAGSSRTAARSARLSAPTATGASTSISGSISTTPSASARSMEPFEPFFVEDPVRDEHALQDIPKLRPMTTVPLTHGEEWGLRWDFNRLVESHDIDFIRATLPNVGGITEMMKVAAMCETHAVGIIPHFTGPIATAALVNCLSTFSGPVMLEYNYGGRPIDYLPECLDFKNGKAYTNQRPGLGATLDLKLLTMIGEVTEPGRRNVYKRPDGSLTHW